MVAAAVIFSVSAAVSEHSFGREYVFHLAVDPARPNKLYAITINPQETTQAVLASTDAGKTWAPLGSATH